MGKWAGNRDRSTSSGMLRACGRHLALVASTAVAFALPLPQRRKGANPMRTSFALLILTTWFPSIAAAVPIHVPADYPTIQAAINASLGDSIIVAPGTYVENLKTNSIPVLLVSEAGPAATIIDGSQPSHPDSGSVIFARSSLTLVGFTITGGTGTLMPNGAAKSGGGLYLLAASTIRGNWITENHVPAPLGVGGGIFFVMQNGGTVRILYNRIYSNSAQYSAGAIHIGWQQVQVENNVIYDNHVQDGTGGAIWDVPEGAVHLRNIYACNTSSSDDGAGAAWGGREFRNCTFVSNEGADAALRLGVGGQTFNSIFAFNIGGGVRCAPPFPSSCNAFFNNTPFQVQGSCIVIGQSGNILVDPAFGDADDCNATFCLAPNSPLLPENSPPGCGLIGAVGVCEVTAIDAATSPDFASGPLLAYPNPLNPQTTLSFVLAGSRHIELGIHDAQGRVVRKLVSGAMLSGRHEVIWDGRNEEGKEVASGAYIAVLKSPSGRFSQKLLVLK